MLDPVQGCGGKPPPFAGCCWLLDQINHIVRIHHLQSNCLTKEYTSPLRDAGKIIFNKLILLKWSKIWKYVWLFTWKTFISECSITSNGLWEWKNSNKDQYCLGESIFLNQTQINRYSQERIKKMLASSLEHSSWLFFFFF